MWWDIADYETREKARNSTLKDLAWHTQEFEFHLVGRVMERQYPSRRMDWGVGIWNGWPGRLTAGHV